MKKAKKPKKVPTQKTALDRITAQLRTVLRRETTDIILVGKLLIEARKHMDHGEWQPYLAENFDLSYRTARNYESAAKYVEKKQKCNVADFANLSATVLYHLAAGHFDEPVEAAILAEARKRRIDTDAAWAIRDRLEPPDDDDADDADDQEDGDETPAAEAPAEDPEITAILDGPPPAVPPPAPNPPPPDFALRDFDQAILTLNRLRTKQPARFAQGGYNIDVLENVVAFIDAVMKARRQ